MSKRFLFKIVTPLIVLGLAVVLAVKYVLLPPQLWFVNVDALTPRQMAEAAKKVQGAVPSSPAVLVPLDFKNHVRLALGSLGLPDDAQNGRLADLVLVQLSDAKGLELVERQSLDAVLHELNLSLSGLVRAKDAVRAGKLLKVDWFVLGTPTKVNGVDSIVVRIVDARTGILRDAGAFPTGATQSELAGKLAAFVRDSRQNAATARTPVFLAIGAFQDVSLGSRQADFPTQLRGYLTAAYGGGKVTLVEREYVETLLQEMHLDAAGLIENSAANLPTPMQSAFWLINGVYQSYETTNLQVEVNLDVHRIFGLTTHASMRGPPGEPIDKLIKQAVDRVMDQNTNSIVPTRNSEIHEQKAIAWELYSHEQAYLNLGGYTDQTTTAKTLRNLEEARRAFEAVLILDPSDNEAKYYLAKLLFKSTRGEVEKVRQYYREIIETEPQDRWAFWAQDALLSTFSWWSGHGNPEEKANWFSSVLRQTTNSAAADFYRKQARLSGDDIAIARGGDKAITIAETRLFDAIKSMNDELHGKPGANYPDMAMGDFAKSFGTNKAAAGQRLAELLPKLTNQFPQLEPYLMACVMSFQVDTNAPIVAEFHHRLDQICEHPTNVFSPFYFWNLLQNNVYPWGLEHKLPSLAVQVVKGKIRAATSPHDKNQDRIRLAYAYAASKDWQQALVLFESFSNQPLLMESHGPWGNGEFSVQPGPLAAICRKKLGQELPPDPRQFDIGKPCFDLCRDSTFLVGDSGLWIGVGGQLLHLGFDLKTNLAVTLPNHIADPISTMVSTPSSIWIGTVGDGLIEYDKASRQCRRFTVKDGLMMDNIASLLAIGNQLWIGYGNGNLYFAADRMAGGGGLGKFDLKSRQFVSFTPSMQDRKRFATNTLSKPPEYPVIAMTRDGSENLWIIVKDASWTKLRCCQPEKQVWGPPQQYCSSVIFGNEQLYYGELGEPAGDKGDTLGVNILDSKTSQWRSLKQKDALPTGLVSTLALDGHNLWVGGLGFIALVDPEQDKLLKFANLFPVNVLRIQVGGGCVWVQFDCRLYRIPSFDMN